MDQHTIKEQLRQYIVREFLPGESLSNLKDDTPLRTSGLLDSMATLQVVTYVEENFGIEVQAHEAGVENFESINTITAFVLGKKSGA
jgi:acyl carrier protein